MERVILVAENKKLRVLYVEAYPRYEFRFVKTLLERETESARSRAVDLDVLWLDASAGHWQLDKSTERLRGALPTKTQLFEYDAIIYGDVNPALLPKANAFYADLSEFVRERGGGLVVLAGEQANPHKLWDSPLAELLPILPTDAVAKSGGPPPTPENPGLREEYLPKPTPLGRTHPMLRFSSNEAENERIWSTLKGFYWGSSGYRRKPAAEVLATHPNKPADGEANAKHPLILQQFVGKGRVVFLGFDETWRWRFRSQEERFNQFWGQLLTAVARNRVIRVELKTDKQTAYRRDEPIRLTVRYPDDAPVPEAGTAVRVAVSRKPFATPRPTRLGRPRNADRATHPRGRPTRHVRNIAHANTRRGVRLHDDAWPAGRRGRSATGRSAGAAAARRARPPGDEPYRDDHGPPRNPAASSTRSPMRRRCSTTCRTRCASR